MTREEAERSALDLAWLVSCGVNGRRPDPARVSEMDLERVYAAAKRNTLGACAAMALESAGFKDARSGQLIANALRRAALFDRALGEVCRALEGAGIWYMPLKGMVLRKLYPKYGMREMADCDILFDAGKAERVRELMEGLGYTTKSFGGSHHDVYHREPVLNFEMHRSLFGPGHEEKLVSYYSRVEERLLGEGMEKHLSREDCFVYLLAHASKHYSGGGTGLRTLLDLYVYRHRASPDMAYVTGEAEKLGLGDFLRRSGSLAEHLFGSGELTAEDREMLGYVLESGTYGTLTHHVQNRLAKTGWSKLRYMLERFSVPVSRKNPAYAAYAAQYPRFYRYRVLLPLLPFCRVCRSIREGRFRGEARAIRKAK